MTCFYDVPKVDTSSGTSPDYKPLPSAVTDFIAEIVCGILETHQPQSFKAWDFIPLPELLLFIEKVTAKAKVDVQTAIASMVLVSRLKKRLPKTAHGEYGTYHKIFLASLLVAIKEFTPKSREEEEEKEANVTENTNDVNSTDDINNTNNDDENDANDISSSDKTNNNDNDTNSNLSQSPTSSIISTTPTSIPSDDEHDDDFLFRNNPTPTRNGFDYKLKRPIINKKVADISGIYNLQEVERMEREFVWRLGGNDKVTDKDIRDYVENNRHALGIC